MVRWAKVLQDKAAAGLAITNELTKLLGMIAQAYNALQVEVIGDPLLSFCAFCHWLISVVQGYCMAAGSPLA